MAGIMAVIIAGALLYKGQSVETDLRSFAVDIRELKTTMTMQQQSFNSLAFQVNQLQQQLQNQRLASN